MPSTRPTPKTMSGAKRPLVSAKTDKRLADPNRENRTVKSFANSGGKRPTRTEFTESNGSLYVSQTRPGYAAGTGNSPKRRLSKSEAEGMAKSKNPQSKAMGSYAANYFKKNSK